MPVTQTRIDQIPNNRQIGWSDALISRSAADTFLLGGVTIGAGGLGLTNSDTISFTGGETLSRVTSDLLQISSGLRLNNQLIFGGTDHAGIRIIGLTTVQRDALSAANGDLVFNTDSNLLQVYHSSQWNSLDTGNTPVWSLNGNKAYYNTDNVGIGITNPLAKLHISSTASTDLLKVERSSTGDYFAVSFAGSVTSVDVSDDLELSAGLVNFLTYSSSDDILRIRPDDTEIMTASTTNVNVAGTFSLSTDVILRRESANALSLRNGTNAQLLNVFNTYTSGTNFEKWAVDWKTTSNRVIVGPVKGSGGGSDRAQVFTGVNVRSGAATTSQFDSGEWGMHEDTSATEAPLGRVTLTYNDNDDIKVVSLQEVDTYNVTNRTTTRSFDANSTSLNEIADVLATLIHDLGWGS